MASAQTLTPSSSEFDTLQEAYGLTPADGVEFPAPSSLITRPSAGKVGIYLKTIDAFQEEMLRCNGCNVQMLTPGVVHKIMAFELICRANNIIPDYFIFKFSFRFAATNDKYTFSAR